MAPSELEVKTGVVRRTLNDVNSYEREAEATRAKISAIESAPADGGERDRLKQWMQALAETNAMIPEAKERLAHAAGELHAALERTATGSGSDADEQAVEASRAVLAEARARVAG